MHKSPVQKPLGVGTLGILSHSRRLAEELSADDGDLLSAASDLVTWGAFEDATRIIDYLESKSRYSREIRLLRGAIEKYKDIGPEFQDRFLTSAIRIASDPTSTGQQLLGAADKLIVWGALDEADRALGRLDRDPALKGSIAALKAASRQLRRSGILSSFSAIGDAESRTLNRPHEALVAKGDANADKTVIVFTGAARRFWMSLHVLHHFLKKFGANVIYLSDHTGAMYLNGLASIAPSYPLMLDMLRQKIDDFGAAKTCVMAISAGGFVGLRTAADLQVDAFLGLSIRTDLSRGVAGFGTYGETAVSKCTDRGMLMDLRPYLLARGQPRHIELYTGDGMSIDVEHAARLRELPNVTVHYLENYRMHNVVPGLLARGQFAGVLKDFLGLAAKP